MKMHKALRGISRWPVHSARPRLSLGRGSFLVFGGYDVSINRSVRRKGKLVNISAVPVIETRGLTKTFKEVNALQSLDLRVRQHSICGFLGPNGAGKSTTIKLLLGLSKPTAGSATVFGHDIVKASTDIRRRVGYLAQDPRYYDHMTARETLRFTARFFYSGPPSLDRKAHQRDPGTGRAGG